MSHSAPVEATPRPVHPILTSPILSTLLRLATPTLVSLTIGTCVVIAETSYIGRLGIEPLAAVALTFPFLMVNMTMSGGAMGGGVSSAVARALGAGDIQRASALAIHALTIGLLFGLVATTLMLTLGPTFLFWLGGRGGVLREAVSYVYVLFGGAWVIWLMNITAAILRGTGNMFLPSAVMFNSAFCQIVIGGALALGIGPIPRFGLPGVAAGTLIAFSSGALILNWYLWSGRGRLKPTLRHFRFERAMFSDILKVGLLACFSPMQSVLTIMALTSFLAHFGTDVLAGYGIGARLEFLLTTIGYSIAIATVPMVGMAIGAGLVARARRVTLIAGCLSALAGGMIGTLAAVFPNVWLWLFTDDPGVRAATAQYLSIVGPLYAFLGIATVCNSASQGAAKMIGPVLAQSGRLLFMIAGGAFLTSQNAPVTAFFVLAGLSMVVVGVGAAASVWLTRWEPSAASGTSNASNGRSEREVAA
jgi:putative MATE family efflux protein